MGNRFPIAIVALSVAFAARANDGIELAMKSKSMAAAAAVSSAPATHAKDPLPELLLRAENEHRSLGGCDRAATDLCYDLREGRMVYRGARQYMPQLQGLRAESVSLRHDGFVLRYSFR